jgi:serine/threonine protein kinase
MSDPTTKTLISADKLGRAKCEHCGTWLDVSDYRMFEDIVCPDCERMTTVPGKLGNYYLLRELGRGGMGAVFLARDQDLERKVALKVMKAKYGQDPAFVDGLVREAKAAAALNHRNVVQIFTFGQEKDQPYIVMELVEGFQLDQRMGPEKRLDEMDMLGILRQIADGLAAADAVGLIHGDIKPGNILVNERGVAKLSDFGIARFGGGGGGRIFGTPLYIAPEKARGKSVDGRADQYSLGASFWHALTGKPPFQGKSAQNVVLARFAGGVPDAREADPTISEATRDLLLRMMAMEPEDRFPDFSAVAQATQAIIDAAEAASAAAAAQAALEREERKRLARNPGVGRRVYLGISIFMLLAMLVAIAFKLLED